MARLAPLLLLVVLLAPGCASAKKSFEKAREAESQGRWEAAADLYIDALRRDPEYPGAREGLEVAGARAIEDGLKLAAQLESSGRLEDAVREFQRIDHLVARAAGVRVALGVPADYASRRAALFGRVVDERLAAAEAMAARGLHEEAAAAYVGATRGLEPTPEQSDRARAGRYDALMAAANQAYDRGEFERAGAFADQAAAVYGSGSEQGRAATALLARIEEARYRALLDAAEAKRSEGRFQEAYALVEDALRIRGPDDAASADARTLRDRIVEEGTQRVAVLPVWRHDRIRNLPPGLLDDVNDALEEHWAEPPLFVAAVDFRVVRGELRRLGFDRMLLGDRQARTAAQMAQADFAVVAYLIKARFDAHEAPHVHPVKTKDGPLAEILVYRTRSLVATCAFRILRVSDGRVVAEGTVEADANRRLRHAVYDGDMRALLLTQQEHEWFDRRRLAEADREILREAGAGVAEGLARAAFEKIVRHLP